MNSIIAWIIIIFLIEIAIWDIWRVIKKQKTITKIIREWIPYWLDIIILSIGIVLFWWLMGGEIIFAKSMILFLLIHFFWPS